MFKLVMNDEGVGSIVRVRVRKPPCTRHSFPGPPKLQKARIGLDSAAKESRV